MSIASENAPSDELNASGGAGSTTTKLDIAASHQQTDLKASGIPGNETSYMAQNGYLPPSSMYNMNDMRSALTGYQSQPLMLDRHPMHQQNHGTVYPMQTMATFPVAAADPGMSFNTQFPQGYAPYMQHPHFQHNNPGYQPIFPTAGQSYVSNFYGHPGFVAFSDQNYQPFPTPMTSHVQPRNPRDTARDTTHEGSFIQPQKGKRRLRNSEYDVSKTIVDGSTPVRYTPDSFGLSKTSRSATPRGPPRKPKQSGHALWVGNLPPGANIIGLKDFFSEDATKDVESVFLISKSNCAFVNYKTEAACMAALSRFHDSKFCGARLVCRLRRGSATAAKADSTSYGSTHQPVEALNENGDTLVQNANVGRLTTPKAPRKYFIVKSLTVEDLELSRQSGIWATQTHNEDTLNHAYETADNVYLIFSANKSGEYYGYARMMSPIQEDEKLLLQMPTRADKPPTDVEELNLTPTPATSTAPSGRIVNDAARGTIFWEADSSEEDDHSDEEGQSEKSAGEGIDETADAETQAIGKPFRIQWLSMERLPFYRTRGLRNPWNANREIKIARDGTEIEPTVGGRLVQLFHTPLNHVSV